MWLVNQCCIFSANIEDGVISMNVVTVLWIQETNTILWVTALMWTHLMFLLACVLIICLWSLNSDWMDNGFILLVGSQHSLGSDSAETCRTGKIWGILSPSIISCPVLEVLFLPLLSSHWPLTPAVVLSGSPDLHSSDCLWVFLTWLYHFLLSVKYRKRWEKKTTKKTVNAADDFIFWLCKL